MYKGQKSLAQVALEQMRNSTVVNSSFEDSPLMSQLRRRGDPLSDHEESAAEDPAPLSSDDSPAAEGPARSLMTDSPSDHELSKIDIRKMEMRLAKNYPVRHELDSPEGYRWRCLEFEKEYNEKKEQRMKKKKELLRKEIEAKQKLLEESDSPDLFEDDDDDVSPANSPASSPVRQKPTLHRPGNFMCSTPVSRGGAARPEVVKQPPYGKSQREPRNISPVPRDDALIPAANSLKDLESRFNLFDEPDQPVRDEDAGNPEDNNNKKKKKHQRPNRRKKLDKGTMTAPLPEKWKMALGAYNIEHHLVSPAPVQQKKKKAVKIDAKKD